jgi:hypothetical protein
MNTVAYVFLIIGISLLGLVIILDIAIGISMAILSKTLRKKNKNLMIVLAQKFDLCVILAKDMMTKGIALPEDIKLDLNLDSNPAKGLKSTTERFLVANHIKNISMTLKAIYDASPIVNEDLKCQTIVNSIAESDSLRANEVVSYNNYAMAYNYWIMFPIFRPLSKLFKIYKVRLLEN